MSDIRVPHTYYTFPYTGKPDDKPSTIYPYNTDTKSVLVSCVIKTKSGVKNVLILTPMHKIVLTTSDERKKLHVIIFYDRTKGGFT